MRLFVAINRSFDFLGFFPHILVFDVTYVWILVILDIVIAKTIGLVCAFMSDTTMYIMTPLLR